MTEKREDVATRGQVALIGCGPGDPELLTLKALRWLERADVIVTDRLVGPGVLERRRADAEIIDVGKEPGGHAIAQSDINRIMVREALKGRHVARLKGGDGFVFGRAVEEMAALRAAGIEVEIIPGITAAHGCAASVALPLTVRDAIRQFSLVTGATASGDIELDWEALSRPGQSFAVYMGVASAPRLRTKLLAAGARPDTPVVIVENGTLETERTILATLDDVAAALSAHAIKGPAILFVGLSWEAANLSAPKKVVVFSRENWAQAAGHEEQLETGRRA